MLIVVSPSAASIPKIRVGLLLAPRICLAKRVSKLDLGYQKFLSADRLSDLQRKSFGSNLVQVMYYCCV